MRRARRFIAAPLIATAVLLAGACDKQPDDDKPADAKLDNKADDGGGKPEKAEAKPEVEPEIRPVLEIAAAKIMPKGQPDKAIEITADGTVKLSADASDGWKLTPDGKVSKADGTTVAEVGADGALEIAGKPSGIILNDRGLILSSPDGRTVTIMFGDDGAVLMEPPPGPGMEMSSEGCSKGIAKTCALVLSLYLLAAGDASEAATAPAAAQ